MLISEALSPSRAGGDRADYQVRLCTKLSTESGDNFIAAPVTVLRLQNNEVVRVETGENQACVFVAIETMTVMFDAVKLAAHKNSKR